MIIKRVFGSIVPTFRSRPVHVALFAIFPIVFLYAYNIIEVTASAVILPLAITLAGTTIILFLANLAFRDWRKSGLLVSLIILIFFSHGRIVGAIGSQDYQIGSMVFSTDTALFLIWFVVVGATFCRLRRTRSDLAKLTGFMNLISLILVLCSLAIVIPYEINRLRVALFSSIAVGDLPLVGEGIENKPDIYYIILDRYANNPALEELYEFDNSEFTDYLSQKGFYVGNQSTTNYPRTVFSLASSLNLDYLDYLTDIAGDNTGDLTFIYPFTREHQVGKFLRSQGYAYFHLGSWYDPTKTNPSADRNIIMGDLYSLVFDRFSNALLNTTLLAPILREVSSGAYTLDFDLQHRDRILHQFKQIKELSSVSGPKFVFAHILIPHEPYVFGEGCELLDLSNQRAPVIPNYLAQLSCANKKVVEAVEAILESSEAPPIIILQADEGPYAMKFEMPCDPDGTFDFKDAPNGAFKERFGILNALLLPGVETDDLYPSITPVNTFRFIFRQYFGADLELLPDKNYIYEDKNHLYKFADVTEKLR